MVLWILVTSQLGHYSKRFGPQRLPGAMAGLPIGARWLPGAETQRRTGGLRRNRCPASHPWGDLGKKAENIVGSQLGSGGGRVQLGGRARPGELRRRPTTAPDPFNVFSLLTPELDGGFDWGDDNDDDSAPPVLLRRSASAGVEGSRHSAAAAARRKAMAAMGLDRRTSVLVTRQAETHGGQG
ncbi:hypothetical protein PLESTB_001361300 [Pleodorina starrii]|uniref:Uncharacterized protein n=1 Tax=Pleodorina starrii TaxID=330485 RepID=A0A9W6BV84_9CHLO|nr:hypothetical protein PLESTB_001361300 [Pleodorina starrii]